MHDNDSSPASIEGLADCSAGGTSPTARIAAAALRQGLLVLLLVSSSGIIAASADEAGASQIACPALLLDHECRAYKADLSSATSNDARDALKARYEGMLSERERACYCNPERSWIRLSETTPVPQDDLQRTIRTNQDKPKIRL